VKNRKRRSGCRDVRRGKHKQRGSGRKKDSRRRSSLDKGPRLYPETPEGATRLVIDHYDIIVPQIRYVCSRWAIPANEDFVHEVILVMEKKLSRSMKYRGDRPCKAFVRKVAYRATLDYIFRRERSETEEWWAAFDAERSLRINSSDARRREFLETWEILTLGLSETEKRALWLHDHKKHTAREVADIMRMKSPGAVYRLLARARQKARRNVRRHGLEPAA